MNNLTISFKKLPKDAQTNVLCQFDVPELFYYSVLSQKCAKDVECSKVKPNFSISFYTGLELFLGRCIDDQYQLTLRFESIWDQEENSPIIENPDTVETETLESEYDLVNDRPGTVMVTKHGFTLKRWIMYLMEIFKLTAVNKVFLGDPVRNQQDIVDILGDIEIHQLCLDEDGLLDVVQLLAKKLSYNQLWITPSITDEQREIKPVLMQNLEAFALVAVREDGVLVHNARSFIQYLQLDELLLMNSEVIQFYQGRDFSKQLNRFLKHWIKGGWNPRCVYVEMLCSNGFMDEDKVLRGINRREQLQESIDVLLNGERFDCQLNLAPFQNGYEIRSKDGRRALLGFPQVNEVVFQFYLPDQDTEKFM